MGRQEAQQRLKQKIDQRVSEYVARETIIDCARNV